MTNQYIETPKEMHGTSAGSMNALAGSMDALKTNAGLYALMERIKSINSVVERLDDVLIQLRGLESVETEKQPTPDLSLSSPLSVFKNGPALIDSKIGRIHEQITELTQIIYEGA